MQHTHGDQNKYDHCVYPQTCINRVSSLWEDASHLLMERAQWKCLPNDNWSIGERGCCGNPSTHTTWKNETERNQWNTNTEIVEINHYYLVAHHQTTMGKHYLASTATNRRNGPTNTRKPRVYIGFLNDTRTCSLIMFNAHTLSGLLNLNAPTSEQHVSSRCQKVIISWSL